MLKHLTLSVFVIISTHIFAQPPTSSDSSSDFEKLTQSPAWTKKTKLSELSVPTSNDIIHWFACYYSNVLSESMNRSNPQIDNVLLDLDTSVERTKIATDQVISLQNPNGGWSVPNSNASDRQITQHILRGYAQLTDLNAVEYCSNIKESQIKALNFIDSLIVDDFTKLQVLDPNWEKSTAITQDQLEYLVVRSSYRDIPISQSARSAEKFYTTVAKKNWKNMDLHQQAMLVIVSNRNADKALSHQILESIRERAIIDDQLGMLWETGPKNSSDSLSDLAQHIYIIEAFLEVEKHTLDTHLMNKRLKYLNQQSAIDPSSSKSIFTTLDAIYAVLKTVCNHTCGTYQKVFDKYHR